MSTPCELCTVERAVMCLYAKNPDTKLPPAERNDNPFYPVEEADFTMNLCVGCFHDMATTMREEKYVGIRGTGVRQAKPAQTI